MALGLPDVCSLSSRTVGSCLLSPQLTQSALPWGVRVIDMTKALGVQPIGPEVSKNQLKILLFFFKGEGED